MVAILEKSKHNIEFHPMVDFVEASPLRRNLKLQDEEGISSLPDMELFENLTLMGYNISPNQKFTFQKAPDEPASLLRDVSQGEACPTDSSFITDQDRATIAKSSTLPYDSAPMVTSPAADEGSMQHTITKLMALCTSLQRQLSELTDKFQAQEVEINQLKERVKQLEVKEGVVATNFREDAPIKGRNAATVLASRVVDVPTGSGSIPTVSTPAEGSVPTGSEEVPTASLIFATATVIARDAEIARIHAEEELQSMINGLDSNNETVAKYLEEYQVEAKFNSVCKQMEDFIPMGSKEEAKKIKRKGINLEQESAKKQKSSKEITKEAKSLEEVTEEKIKEMMQFVPIEEETLSKRPATSDKEMKLWVELSRLYEPNMEDQLWTHTQNFMHAPAEWKLYEKCGVHQLTSKDKDIFMLVEKEYPLRKGLALVMISYKLQVENYLQMADDLVRKIYNIANSPRQQVDALEYELGCSRWLVITYKVELVGGQLSHIRLNWIKRSRCSVVAYKVELVGGQLLRIRIHKNSNGYILTQSHYIEKTLKKFGHYDDRPVVTPFDPKVQLKKNKGQTAADMDFGDINFSNLNMGGSEGFDAEGDEDDSDTKKVKEEEAIVSRKLHHPLGFDGWDEILAFTLIQQAQVLALSAKKHKETKLEDLENSINSCPV
nr:retrovirus-related Pol polyprotein from transposon TNT 1-94 [Tanacetum cinerariifolium]